MFAAVEMRSAAIPKRDQSEMIAAGCEHPLPHARGEESRRAPSLADGSLLRRYSPSVRSAAGRCDLFTMSNSGPKAIHTFPANRENNREFLTKVRAYRHLPQPSSLTSVVILNWTGGLPIGDRPTVAVDPRKPATLASAGGRDRGRVPSTIDSYGYSSAGRRRKVCKFTRVVEELCRGIDLISELPLREFAKFLHEASAPRRILGEPYALCNDGVGVDAKPR